MVRQCLCGCVVSRHDCLRPPIDSAYPRPWGQAEVPIRQCFAVADDENTAYSHLSHEMPQRVVLQRCIEVREGYVPTQDEVKRFLGRRLSNVLREKGHRLPKLRLDTGAFGCVIEPLRAPALRQIPYTARRVPASLGPGDGLIVDVGRQNDEPNGRKSGLEL